MTEHGRRYSDREMAVILRVATEMEAHATPSLRVARSVGRTLSEIESIAADAGIAPEAVRAAATALEADEQGFMARFLGAPTMFRLERTVRGEVSSQDLVDLAGTVRWVLAKEGEVKSMPDGVEWQHKTSEGPFTQISVTTRAGQTRIRLLAKYQDPATWTLLAGGSFVAVSTALGIMATEPGLAGIAGLAGGASIVAWASARAFWRRLSRRAQRQLRGVIDRLEIQARDSSVRTELDET